MNIFGMIVYKDCSKEMCYYDKRVINSVLIQSCMVERYMHLHESGRIAKPDNLDAIIGHEVNAWLREVDPYGKNNIRISMAFDGKANRPTIRFWGEVSKNYLHHPEFKDRLQSIALSCYNRAWGPCLEKEASVGDFDWSMNEFVTQSVILEKNAAGHNTGDSGGGIGVAVRHSDLFLPWERLLSHDIARIVDDIFHANGVVPQQLANAGIEKLEGLRADGKVDVCVTYQGGDLWEINEATIHANHEKTLSLEELREKLTRITETYLHEFAEGNPHATAGTPTIYINPMGAWTDFGGASYDAGCSAEKPQNEHHGSHGNFEDSLVCEDGSKLSGPGLMWATHCAAQLTAADLADYAKVMFKMRGGQTHPSLLNVVTNETSRKSQEELKHQVYLWMEEGVLPKNFAEVQDRYKLREPETYRRFAQRNDVFVFRDKPMPWTNPQHRKGL